MAATDAYRVVHGEGDQLPGLVIDRYVDSFVLQTLDQGMDRAKADIVNRLADQVLAWHRSLPPGPMDANAGKPSLPLPGTASPKKKKDAK